MKRGKPLKRKKELKADVEKVREFQQRGRGSLSGGGQPLARSKGLGRGNGSKKASNSGDRPKAPPVGPLTPGDWRRAVWALDEGKCVMCRVPVAMNADRWTWQAHHPIEKQKLPNERKYDPRNGVVTCRRCHEKHTTWTEVIPGEKLPERCRAFAAEMGEGWLDLLDRAHPTGPAAGSSGAQNVPGGT